MAQLISFEDAVKDAPNALDMALQAEGVTGKVADIARSIYAQESGSGANTSTSNRGAVGGMQILRGTFQRMADKGWDIKDPVHNARAGIRYVQEMHDLAGGDPELTAAGYYGGPGGLEKARKGIAVSDPVNPGAPNTLEYGRQVAARLPAGPVAQALDKVASAVIPSANAQEAHTGPKKTPRVISFEEALQGAPEPAAAAPAKRSMIDELGRQLGLTARAAVTGVASIPAMMSDAVTGPINSGLDAVAGKGNGFRFQPASQALGNIMTGAGVPVPESATERVVQDAASSVAGAGSMVKGGLALANSAAGPAARGVGELLATGPGLQLASAATGSGASGVVRENGGGEGAQIAAGLVGSMAPSAATLAGRRPNGSKQLGAAAEKANNAGYVVPPADLNPGFITEVVSALSGKIKTAQVASQRNQAVTNDLARKALGIPKDVDLTIDTLAAIRRQAGEAYQAVASSGLVTPTSKYADAIDDAVKPFLSQAKSFPNRKMPSLVDDIMALKTGQFDAGDAVQTIKVIRNEADSAYRAGDKMGGKAYKQAAQALEDALDEHLVKTGAPPDVLKGYRDARKTIAKTYTVEKALNPQTGNVNAQKLASELAKGKPLSGELQTIAEVGQAFPKAMQALKEAPKQVSVLDIASGGGMAALAHNPALIVGPAIARPAARSVLLSKPMQRLAVKNAGVVNTGIAEGLPAAAVGAATRATGTQQPTPQAPRTISWEEAQLPAATQSAPRIELNGMAQPDAVGPESGQSAPPAAEQGTQPGQPVSSVDGGQVAPDGTQQQEVAQQHRPEFDPATVFTSQQRDDGTLAVQGDSQALGEVMVASGIPARSIAPMRGGILVGRSQAAKVQSAIDALHAPVSEVAQTSDQNQPVAPADIAQAATNVVADGGAGITDQAPIDTAAHAAATSPHNDLPEPTLAQQKAGNYRLGHDRIAGMDVSIENPQGSVRRGVDADGKPWETQMQMGDLQAPPDEPQAMATATVEPQVAQAPADQPDAAPDAKLATIQRLRDSGEEAVAAMLQRDHERTQTLESARNELASMRDRTPDLPHHGDPAFNDHYQQRRMAGIGPAEASAHAGITAGVHEIASKIGLPDPALKALTAKLQDMPIEDAPGFVERFTQKLIEKGVMKPFDGADQIASILTQARDQAMHGALNSLYGDNPATTHA